MKRFYLILITIFSLTSSLVYTQNEFKAIPEESSWKYHINFEKVFFISPGKERESYEALKEMLTRLESYKGRVASSSNNLLNALVLNDSITVQNSLHDAYLYLRFAVNTKDVESSDNESELNSEVYSRTQFLQQELIQISENDLTRFIKEKPELKYYLFAIESARRLKAHTLSLAEEETVGKIYSLMTDWQYELYQNLIKRTQFSKVKTKEGDELNVWTQRGTIMNNPDRNVRELGFKNRISDFAKQRDLFSYILINIVKARNSLSQLFNYKDYPEESYFNKYLDTEDVKALLKKVESYTDVIKKFELARANHIKKIRGYKDINYWDISAGTGTIAIPRFDINLATKNILGAVRPLGKEYESEMAALLDPSNGRLDIVPGDDRLSGGGGTGFPGIPNVFYAHGYEGFYKDVSVLIHEGGHVVHFQLMGNNNVKAVYGRGPNYFSESFAIFNELLLADYLYQNEEDISKKIFYLEQFLDVKGLEIFRGAQDAQLEQSIYNAVEEDKIKSADDFDTLTLNALSKYTIWADIHPDEFKGSWMLSRLLYEDPMYLVNYLYGGLLSLKYYEMFKTNPGEFVKKYLALMRNGFNDTPTVLLKKFLDIDLNDPQLLNDSMKLLEKKINELQLLYSKAENN